MKESKKNLSKQNTNKNGVPPFEAKHCRVLFLSQPSRYPGSRLGQGTLFCLFLPPSTTPALVFAGRDLNSMEVICLSKAQTETGSSECVFTVAKEIQLGEGRVGSADHAEAHLQ